MKRLFKITAMLLAVAIFATAMAGCGENLNNPTAGLLGRITIAPTKSDDGGISCDTQFFISADDGLSLSGLKNNLKVDPAFEFDIASSKGGYTLTPKEELTENTVYGFTLGDEQGESRTWAFQTKRPFEITRVSPVNDSTGVYIYGGVEIYSSHMGVDMQNHFSISPDIEMRYEQRGYQSTFFPQTEYKQGTKYTVTIKKGLKSPLGDTLDKDYIFSFTTGKYNNDRKGDETYISAVNGFTETILPDDVPVVEVSASENVMGKKFTSSVYKLNDIKQYIDIMNERDAYYDNPNNIDEYLYDTTELKHIKSYDTIMQKGVGWLSWKGFLVLPQTLEKGWYLIDCSATIAGKDIELQKLLQVSETSLYTQSSSGSTLAWVNSTATGNPIEGAEVGYIDDDKYSPQALVKTDKDGVATVDTSKLIDKVTPAQADGTPNYAGQTRMYVKANGEEFVDNIRISPPEELSMREKYYTMIVKDREIYRPTDKVSFFGKIAPRKDEYAMPKQLKAQMTSTKENRSTGEYQEVAIAECDIVLQPNGSFTGEISYENLPSTGYSLRIIEAELAAKVGASDNTEPVMDKQIYIYDYINVYDFAKPLYKSTVTSSKNLYIGDEPIDFTIQSTFYNGEYAPNLTFNVNGTEIVTDTEGKATYMLSADKAQHDTPQSWTPQSHYAYFETSGMQNVYESIYASALVFPRDTMLLAEPVQDGKKININVDTYKVDTSRIKGKTDVWKNYPDNLKGDPTSSTIKVEVYKHEYIKVKQGSYYDPINKKSQITYYYKDKETLIKTFNANTVNGKAVLNDLPQPESNEIYYKIVLSMNDSKGKPVQESAYLNYYDVFDDDSMYTDRLSYSFDAKKHSADPYSGGYYGDSYRLNMSYTLGEQVSVKFREKSKPAENKGTILYTVMGDGVVERGLSKENGFTVTMKESYLPNVNFYGAYFDGKHIFSVLSDRIIYNSDERDVNVTIKPEKTVYRPGDEVTAEVYAKDLKGTPVEGDLGVAIVDEAVFAVSPQSLDPVANLYTTVYYNEVTIYTSYYQHVFYEEGGGGKGGGGPDTGGGAELRKDIKDTAAFVSTKTDKNGKAKVTFKLPDNLTSWRITASIVNDKLYAGTGLTNVTTNLPVFVSPIATQTFISGDEVVFSARAYGEKIDNTTQVKFTATVKDEKGKKTELETTQTADKQAVFNFDKLPTGSYTVTFGVEADGSKDALEQPFMVKQSGVETSIVKGITAAQLGSISAARYPVWIGFYDSEYKNLMSTLGNLSCAWGNRVDQNIATDVAGKLLKEYADDKQELNWLDDDSDVDFSDYQDATSGGIRVYSYDMIDPQLTARVAVAAPEYFNTETMADYLYRIIQESSIGFTDESNGGGTEGTQSATAAVMGLAALKYPVLTDAKAMMNKADVLTDIDMLYLTAALAYLGDTEGAKAAYEKYVAPYLTKSDAWTYYDVTKGTDGGQQYVDGPVYKGDVTTPVIGGKGELIYQQGGKGMEGYYQAMALSTMGANLQRTALAMLINMQLGGEDTERMLAYVRENHAYDMDTLLEQVAYAKNYTPSYTEKSVVSYKQGGLLRKKAELSKTGIKYVCFTEEQLKNADVRIEKGNIGMVASYVGTPGELAPSSANNGIAIEKTIATENGKPLAAGDKVRVTIKVHLDENAPKGGYTISEWIPTCLRFNAADNSKYDDMWVDTREGQMLKLSLYNYEYPMSEDKEGKPIYKTEYIFTYLANYAVEGNSAIDSTYIVNNEGGMVSGTPKNDTTIGTGFKTYSSNIK